VAAANANNSVCGVGVAFDAQVAGIKSLKYDSSISWIFKMKNLLI
jgi:hypothetical protein